MQALNYGITLGKLLNALSCSSLSLKWGLLSYVVKHKCAYNINKQSSWYILFKYCFGKLACGLVCRYRAEVIIVEEVIRNLVILVDCYLYKCFPLTDARAILVRVR